MLKYVSAGMVYREKKEKYIIHEAVDTTGGTHIVAATKRSTHPLTAVQQNLAQQRRPRSDPPTHHALHQYSK